MQWKRAIKDEITAALCSLGSDNVKSLWCHYHRDFKQHCGKCRKQLTEVNLDESKLNSGWFWTSPKKFLCKLFRVDFSFVHTHCHCSLPKFSVGEIVDQSVITTQWLLTWKEFHEIENGDCQFWKMRKPRTTSSAGTSEREKFVLVECLSVFHLAANRDRGSGSLISWCPEHTGMWDLISVARIS